VDYLLIHSADTMRRAFFQFRDEKHIGAIPTVFAVLSSKQTV